MVQGSAPLILSSSLLRNCVAHCIFLSHRPKLTKGWSEIEGLRRRRIRILKVKQFSIFSNHRPPPIYSLENGDNNAYGGTTSESDEGSTGRNDKGEGGSLTSTEILKRLRRYGISGLLSYGLLNTVYYSVAFLLVWFYVAPAPGRMGYLSAVERFLKIMAMVWAGSQVTKLIRAGGALALAPFVDRGLSWFTAKFKFESQGKAFMMIVGFCIGLALMLFLIVTALCA